MENVDEIESGTTTLGIVFENGVVLAADNRATMGNLKVSKSAQKVFKIEDNIGITIAGSVGDAQRLIRLVRAELKLYKLETKEISVKGASTLLSNILQGSKMMPFMNQFVIGGIDKDGGVVYDLDPLGGLMDHEEYTATGSGSLTAFGVLEDSYEEEMNKEEAIKLAVRAVQAASERDIASGDGIDVVTITEEESFQEVDKEDVEEYLEN
ncbi:MAG: archaeal proteasome endopeptidase complex subunit beta [Candidatus Nanohaloarchaeota archaeon QJJ-9]|nr:archaeal proteasome endopeptidase complex subunit beta [Candidatus Nanohaloarchaeota archaeon QJJ-9]